jgi:DNA invertase Pin-like site-specific DNA recombinase
MIVGYARVSTPDQCLDLQRTALLEARSEKIFEDKVSGKAASRPGLQRTLDSLGGGDTLVVWMLDRLGRSMSHLVDLICKLSDKRIRFRSLTDLIDTSTPSGRFFFHTMARMSEMERELASERTRAGLEAARRKGRIGS